MIDGRFSQEDELHREVRFEGFPNEPVLDKKTGRWESFKSAFKELTKGKFGFGFGPFNMSAEVERDRDGSDKSRAEVSKTRAEANKLAVDAAEAKERLEEAPLNRVIKENDEIRKIFSDEKTPDKIKLLQLMNLMKVDPELGDQIGKVEELAAKLKIKHGVEVHFLLGSEKAEEAIEDPPVEQKTTLAGDT